MYDSCDSSIPTQATQAMFPDTVYGHASTQTRLQSETADNVLWGRYATPPVPHPALSRISFETVHTPLPLHTLIDHISNTAASLRPPYQRFGNNSHSAVARFLVVCGRSRRLAVENHHAELKTVMEEHSTTDAGGEVRKTIGDVAASIVLSQCNANVVVIQATHVAD